MRLGWEGIDCIFVDIDDLDLPVMIPDLDIYRSANVLVKHHGEAPGRGYTTLPQTTVAQ